MEAFINFSRLSSYYLEDRIKRKLFIQCLIEARISAYNTGYLAGLAFQKGDKLKLKK